MNKMKTTIFQIAKLCAQIVMLRRPEKRVKLSVAVIMQ